MSKFRLANNDVSQYAFLCGHVQAISKDSLTVMLFSEHNTYHIQFTDNFNRIVWLSFKAITEARKQYKLIKNSIMYERNRIN